MRSDGKMASSVLPVRALLVSAFILVTFTWNASGQDIAPNTTLNPLPSPSDTPLSPSSTEGAPSSITCCYVQTACNNCSEVYNVNSIIYCCPNCRGMVLVTDLVCRCSVPDGYQVSDLKCKMSDKVVGNYVALRPSYYDAGGSEIIKASSVLLFVVLLAVATL